MSGKMCAEKNLTGISRTTFLAGLVAAILVSSLLSVAVTTQWAKGPQGDKGDTGDIGPQGLTGPSGISKIPMVYEMGQSSYQLNGPTYPNWVDVSDPFFGPLSVQISTANQSHLLILFYAYLRGEWRNTTIGWARIDIRALVDNELTWPSSDLFFSGVQSLETPSWTYGANVESHSPYLGAFNAQVTAGMHTVKMQWSVLALTSATMLDPYLVVYALPDT